LNPHVSEFKHLVAAITARSTSSAVAAPTLRITKSLAGLIVSKVPPLIGFTHLPSILLKNDL